MLNLIQSAGLPGIRFNKNMCGFRPDILIADHNLAIECDGIYYHSEKFRDSKYHNDKALAFEKANVRCFQFRENEILLKPEICLSMISVACKKAIRVLARDTKVAMSTSREVAEFFEANHLMGHNIAVKAISLLDKHGEIQACLSYQMKKDGALEIARLAFKLNTVVVGAA
jgi:very-short-patch-repair endonuclease